MSMSQTLGRLLTARALLCSLLLVASRSLVFAAPSIEVDLQAAFPAPPFLLELLYVGLHVFYPSMLETEP